MFSSEPSISKTQYIFLKFFQRRDKFRFLIKKRIEGRKNEVIWNLSSSIIKKFNGYETIKHEFARKERIQFTPINIVYEPIYDENVPVPCYFTDKIHIAYRSCIGQYVKGEGEKNIKHSIRW